MTILEIAVRLVELSRKGDYETAQNELFATDAVSIEPANSPGMQTVVGLEAIIAKGKHFQEMIEEVHHTSVSNPIVGGNHFSISLSLDVTMKGIGRNLMEEICVYKVIDEKIISEQFFY